MTDHDKLDNLHPTDDELVQVLSFVESLGLRGVVMVGHPCPHCGCLHDITTSSDIDNDAVKQIMEDYIEGSFGPYKTLRKGASN